MRGLRVAISLSLHSHGFIFMCFRNIFIDFRTLPTQISEEKFIYASSTPKVIPTNEELTTNSLGVIKDFREQNIDSFDAGIFYQTYYDLNTEGLDTPTESC